MEQFLDVIEKHGQTAFWLGVFILIIFEGLIKLIRNSKCSCQEEENNED